MYLSLHFLFNCNKLKRSRLYTEKKISMNATFFGTKIKVQFINFTDECELFAVDRAENSIHLWNLINVLK